ncbi:HK97 gp10 family phage protein [Tardiphaga sp. 839_C3_N1_4]|uniref:HK97 gp10 family phage protein n=1 Tax=Tardiphaga sp. 839_C3_N1_4 TaxID=3240761 RepID=UPI003F26A73C
MSVVENVNFAATVDDWVKETEARMLAVFRESTQRVVSMAANGVPIDTGFARASIRASTEQMPPINAGAVPPRRRREDEERGSLHSVDLGSVVLTINGAQLGDTVYAGWTAAYVIYLEYGSSLQAPAGFVRLAAAQWQVTVDQVTQEAKGRAGRS